MQRFTIATIVLIAAMSVGCHRGIRTGGLLGHRYLATTGSCQTCDSHGPVVPAGYETHADCGCDVSGSGCNRCNGERARFRDTAGMPLVSRIAQGLTCGSGCGEVYWGEWISTPPKPDPCDSCGNYTGVPNSKMYRPHRQPVRKIVRAVAGVRYGSPCRSCGSNDPCGCDAGCSSCGSTTADDCGCGSGHGVHVPAVTKPSDHSVPAPQPRADQPIRQTSFVQPASHSSCKTCQH